MTRACILLLYNAYYIHYIRNIHKAVDSPGSCGTSSLASSRRPGPPSQSWNRQLSTQAGIQESVHVMEQVGEQSARQPGGRSGMCHTRETGSRIGRPGWQATQSWNS